MVYSLTTNHKSFSIHYMSFQFFLKASLKTQTKQNAGFLNLPFKPISD